MYSMKMICDEIRAEVDRRMLDNEREVEPAWVAQAVMSAHPYFDGSDSDFYVVATRQAIHHEARQIINQVNKGEPPGTSQIVMDGFNHLQRYYVVERNGRRPAVRIDLLSRAELEAKLREHEARAETEAEHAREIRRYIDIRFGAASAA